MFAVSLYRAFPERNFVSHGVFGSSSARHSSPCLLCVHGGPDGVCHRPHHRQAAPNVSCALFRADSGARSSAAAERASSAPDAGADGAGERDYREPVCLVDIVTGDLVHRWPDAAACARGMGVRRASRIVEACRTHRIANRSRYALRFLREYEPEERFRRRAPILQVAETGELEAVYPCSAVAAEHAGLDVKDVERAVSNRAVVSAPSADGSGERRVRFERMSAMGQTHLSDRDVAPFLVDFKECAVSR